MYVKSKANDDLKNAPKEHAWYRRVPYSEVAEVLRECFFKDISLITIEVWDPFGMFNKPIIAPRLEYRVSYSLS